MCNASHLKWGGGGKKLIFSKFTELHQLQDGDYPMTCHKILCLALVGRDRRAAVAEVEVGNAAASAPALPHPAWCFSVSNRERPSTVEEVEGHPHPKRAVSLVSHPLLLPRRSALGHPPRTGFSISGSVLARLGQTRPPSPACAAAASLRRRALPQAPDAPGRVSRMVAAAPHDDATPRSQGRRPTRRGPAGRARPPAARAAGRGTRSRETHRQAGAQHDHVVLLIHGGGRRGPRPSESTRRGDSRGQRLYDHPGATGKELRPVLGPDGNGEPGLELKRSWRGERPAATSDGKRRAGQGGEGRRGGQGKAGGDPGLRSRGGA